MSQILPVTYAPTARQKWYLVSMTAILVLAASLRLWGLRGNPPGMSTEEFINVQLADMARSGGLSVMYDQVVPTREGLYYLLLALVPPTIGHGVMAWRLPSVWMGMLTIAATASLSKRLFGQRTTLVAAGLMAVSLWPVMLSRSISHVVIMPLVTVITLYMLTRAFVSTGKSASALWFTLSGVMLAMAQYAHLTGWAVLLIPVIVILIRWRLDGREIRRHWWNIYYTLVLVAVLLIPFMLFLINSPNARRLDVLTQPTDGLVELLSRPGISLLGLIVQGDYFSNHNLPGRPVLEPVGALLLIIGCGAAIARWRQPSYSLLLVWLGTGILPTFLVSTRVDFDYMIVIQPAIFIVAGVGYSVLYRVAQTFSRPRGQVSAWLAPVAAILLIIGNAAWTYNDYFAIWRYLPEVASNYQTQLGAVARYLDTTTDPEPISVCAPPVDRTQQPFALSSDQALYYLMHREGLYLRYFDCTQTLLLINGGEPHTKGGEPQRLVFPRGRYYDYVPGPLLEWMKYTKDEASSDVPPDVILRIDASKSLADTAGAFITTAPVAWAPETGQFRLALLPVAFGHNVTFLGYTIRDDTLRPGDYIELITYWRLDGPPPPELTMFAHLLGSPVVVLAQNDNLGVNVGMLQPRDVFIQYSLLQVPPGTSPGLYPLSVGLYLPGSGTRLEAFEGGVARSDRLFLRRITVTP